MQNLLVAEHLIEILLQLITPLFDVFGTVVGNFEYLFLGERRSYL